MKKFTPERAFPMMNAINDVYGNQSLRIENAVYTMTAANCPDYKGGVWDFHSDGTKGFWVPQQETVAVECENYYQNPEMDAESFGVAVTLMALNRLVWMYHEQGKIDLAREMQTHYQALYDYAFEDHSALDTSAIYSFLD